MPLVHALILYLVLQWAQGVNSITQFQAYVLPLVNSIVPDATLDPVHFDETLSSGTLTLSSDGPTLIGAANVSTLAVTEGAFIFLQVQSVEGFKFGTATSQSTSGLLSGHEIQSIVDYSNIFLGFMVPSTLPVVDVSIDGSVAGILAVGLANGAASVGSIVFPYTGTMTLPGEISTVKVTAGYGAPSGSSLSQGAGLKPGKPALTKKPVVKGGKKKGKTVTKSKGKDKKGNKPKKAKAKKFPSPKKKGFML